jgi:hypothetical protein
MIAMWNKKNLPDKVKANIVKSSMAHPKPDHLISAQEIQRNSLDNIKIYQHRLRADEIDLIKRKTEDVASYFYSSNDY